MAAVETVGATAPRTLRRTFQDCVFTVAEEVTQIGLGRAAILHGSAVSGDSTFIDTGIGLCLASDIDVLVMAGLRATEAGELQARLTGIFSATLGRYAGPNTKVSIKNVDQRFLCSAESRSLLRSASGSGRSARHVWQLMPGRDRHPSVAYPFAAPYAVWRFLNLIGHGHKSDACAVYELVKGISRAMNPESRVGYAGTVVLQLPTATRFVLDHISWIQPYLAEPELAAVVGWLVTPIESRRMPIGWVDDTKSRLIGRIHMKWPSSLLIASRQQPWLRYCA